MYHDIAKDDVDIEAWTVVRESEFRKQIEYLKRYFTIVSLDQAIDCMAQGKSPERPLVALTFDDGDSGNISTLLPIVEALEFPVTIYVATAQVCDGVSPWFDQIINATQTTRPCLLDLTSHALRKYMISHCRGPGNWVEIQRLLGDLKSLDPGRRVDVVAEILRQLHGEPKRVGACICPLSISDVQTLSSCPLITLGAHSHCHSILTQLSIDEAEDSISRSKSLLERWTGGEVKHFSFPNGNYDAQLIGIVEKLGFASATTTHHSLWKKSDSSYRIPRIGVGRYDTMAKFKVQVGGGMLPFF